ncbi:hypothetical protein ACLOJK_028270, partial [Asimina triloba]
MGHGSRFDPIIGDHKHDAKHFVLSLIQPKAWISRSKPSIELPSTTRAHCTTCTVSSTVSLLAPDEAIQSISVVHFSRPRNPFALTVDRHDRGLDRTIQAAHRDAHQPDAVISAVACNQRRLVRLPDVAIARLRSTSEAPPASCYPSSPTPVAPCGTPAIYLNTSSMSASPWMITAVPRQRPTSSALKTRSQLQVARRLGVVLAAGHYRV